jgi:hypothetical protein
MMHFLVLDKTIIASKSENILRSAILTNFGGESIGSWHVHCVKAIITLLEIVLGGFG